MWKLILFGIFSTSARTIAQTHNSFYSDEDLLTTTMNPKLQFSEDDKITDTSSSLEGINDLDFTITAVGITSESSTSKATTDKELLYLELEYEYANREEFWKENRYECINETLVPSPYLRRKYWECEWIHRHNPKCTNNCKSAITMLLGEDRIPHMELYESFFSIVLPERLRDSAVKHYQHCFDSFGNDKKIFLDYSCERPEHFYSCAHEFKQLLLC